jgi:hypothetical protein
MDMTSALWRNIAVRDLAIILHTAHALKAHPCPAHDISLVTVPDQQTPSGHARLGLNMRNPCSLTKAPAFSLKRRLGYSLIAMACIGLPAFQSSLQGQSSAPVEADVCIYGGTSGGVAAAVQAARMGKRVVLAEPGGHLGGMTSGGLSAVDIGDPRSVGGIAREYFTRLAATVGVVLAWDKAFESKGGGPATGGAYAIEPHKAEQVFNDMAREAGVKVHLGARLATV